MDLLSWYLVDLPKITQNGFAKLVSGGFAKVTQNGFANWYLVDLPKMTQNVFAKAGIWWICKGDTKCIC